MLGGLFSVDDAGPDVDAEPAVRRPYTRLPHVVFSYSAFFLGLWGFNWKFHQSQIRSRTSSVEEGSHASSGDSVKLRTVRL